MEKEEIITRAREFAEKTVTTGIENYTKEDYFMFLISKFLLLKESIIKKNIEEGRLIFDYKKNGKYLPIIKYIVDHTNLKPENAKEGIKVEIKNISKDEENIEEYIRIFNSLRNALAHGRYSFDFDTGMIDINNQIEDESCALMCQLPISLFELFNYAMEEPNFIYSKDGLVKYKEYINKNHKLFRYIQKEGFDILEDYFKHNSISNLEDEKNFVSSIIEGKNKASESPKEYNVLIELLAEIEKNSFITDLEREKVFACLQKQNFLNIEDGKYQIKVPTSIEKANEQSIWDEHYSKALSIVIKEIVEILNVDKKEEQVALASVYNYMQLIFSLNNFDFLKEKNNLGLGYLKMKNLRIIGDNEDEYSKQIIVINSLVKEFIEEMKKVLEQYKIRSIPVIRDSINSRMKNFYDNMLDKLATKNSYVLRGIRNSIDHANIQYHDGLMILNDQTNQNERIDFTVEDGGLDLTSTDLTNSSVNFVCYGSVKDFFKVTNSLERNSGSEGFSFEDFLGELEVIIEPELFKGLLSVIEQINKINEQALVDSLSQVAQKK